MSTTASATINPREKRQFTRYEVTGYIPCTINDQHGQKMDAMFIDVSSKGMGMLMEPGPRPGDFLWITFDDDVRTRLRFRVQWVAANLDIQKIEHLHDMERIGIALMDEAAPADWDLVNYLKQFDTLEISE